MRNTLRRKILGIYANNKKECQTNTDSEVYRIFDRNDIFEYTSIKNGWVRLKGAGYVMEELIEVIEEEKSPRE